MRDLMRQKVDQKKSEWQFPSASTHACILSDAETAQELDEVLHLSDDPQSETYATIQEPLNGDTTNIDADNESE